MPEQRSFTIQSLLATFVLNAVLLGALYYYFVVGNPIPGNLDPTLFFWIVGGVLTLLLWLAVWFIGRGALNNADARLHVGGQRGCPARAGFRRGAQARSGQGTGQAGRICACA